MNVLVLGSGGREHAISWKLVQSPKLSKLFVAPGNAGTSDIAENINVDVNDFEGIKEIVLNNQIDLVIVGPEDPLVNGIVDFFLKDDEIKNTPIIGPQAEDGIRARSPSRGLGDVYKRQTINNLCCLN